MKKFLLTIACTAVAALTFAQKDISVVTDSPMDNAPYSGGDMLSLDITITNNGVEDIDIATDTIYFYLSSGPNILAAGSLETLLPSVLTAGSSESITVSNVITLPDNVASDTYGFCSGVVIFSDTVVTETDDTNNEDCFTIDLTTTASVDELVLNTTTVYPNPANDVVKFELSQGAEEIVIYDVNGKAVKTVNVENAIETVSVSDLESGIYVYTVKFENGELKQEKLVVSK